MYRIPDNPDSSDYLIWQGNPFNCNITCLNIVSSLLLMCIQIIVLTTIYYSPTDKESWMTSIISIGLSIGFLFSWTISPILDEIENLILYLNVDILEKEIYLPKEIPLPPAKKIKEYPPDHGFSNNYSLDFPQMEENVQKRIRNYKETTLSVERLGWKRDKESGELLTFSKDIPLGELQYIKESLDNIKKSYR